MQSIHAREQRHDAGANTEEQNAECQPQDYYAYYAYADKFALFDRLKHA